jgi:prepilin-type N-terminal cleavage/methylation domain-containing protein
VRELLLRLRRCERGFSLSEMLVVIVVLAFIGMAFAAIFSSVVNHSATISESITLQTETRAALDRFASDFRQAYNGDPTFLNPTSPIESVTSGTQITFTTPDRQNPLRLRRVSYRISGGQLQRADVFSTDTNGWPWVWPGTGAVGPYRTLVTNITTVAPFTFYDANGSTTTTASAVTGAQLDFTVRTNRGRSTRFTERVTVRSDI